MPATAHERPVIVVAGPTAGGKTALSVTLALSLPGGGECINADSMQVYRGMDIGTAKPGMDERAGVPHHLIDVADPSVPWSAEQWLSAAEQAVADIRERGRWPVLVGGTNLYLQAFYYGLFDGPPANDALRAELDALDAAALRARLEADDPDAAARIHPNDRRRSIRAIEVAASGTQLSAAQTQWDAPHRSDALLIGLDWPVVAINRRINARVKLMAQAGLLDEVAALAPSLGPTAAEALGYKQLLPVVTGAATLDEALEQVKIRTRRFAKQQRTWLRRLGTIKPACWLKPAEISTEVLAEQALAWILGQAGH